MNCFLRVLGESWEFVLVMMLLLWILRPQFHGLCWEAYKTDMQLWWFQQEKLSGYIICKKKKKNIFSKNIEVQADTCSVSGKGHRWLDFQRKAHLPNANSPNMGKFPVKWHQAEYHTKMSLSYSQQMVQICITWQKSLCGPDWGSWSWEIILIHNGPDDRKTS